MKVKKRKKNNLSSNDDDVHDLYNKLYDDLIMAKKNVNLFKKIIANLEIDIDVLQKENDMLKKKIESLNILI